MLSAKQWKDKEKELVELEKQRGELKEQLKELSRKIHILQVNTRNHNKLPKEKETRTNSEVYKMFGKSIKELTTEEYKAYYNARQKINRQKRKNYNKIKITF